MSPSIFCSAKFSSVLWKSLLTALGSAALAASQPWLAGGRLPASSLQSAGGGGSRDLGYTPQELHALRTVDRAIRGSGSSAAAESVSRRGQGRLGAGLRVGMRWVVGVERVRPQGMKPPGEQKVAANYSQSLRDLAVFRYEVVSGTPDGGFEVRILPIQDSGAQVNTQMIDPRVAEVRLTLDAQGRQVAKAYIYRKDAALDSVKVDVSPDGIRSKLTALEVFPLDWPSELSVVDGVTSRGLRGEAGGSGSAEPRVPAGLAELILRSEHAAAAQASGNSPIRALFRGTEGFEAGEGSDFFGRPIVARLLQGFPWPAVVETAQGVAVLLKIESRGEG